VICAPHIDSADRPVSIPGHISVLKKFTSTRNSSKKSASAIAFAKNRVRSGMGMGVRIW
jgi:hypothetical protein